MAVRPRAGAGRRWPRRTRRAKIQAARSTAAVDGGAGGSPRSRGDGRRRDAGHAAGVDEREVVEVDVDVEGDAVVADAALDAQAEGADLARRRAVRVAPAAGMAVAPGGRHAERGAGLDEGRLERAHERAHQQLALVEPEDRVGHELARARDRSPRRRARRARPRCRGRRARPARPGCGPGRCSGRGSGRPDARGAGAGRRSCPATRSSTRRRWSACASR